MKKLIDFDALFDEKLTQYMEENAGKYTEKQWESVIPNLYKQFGDIYIKKAGDTPKGYYAKMTGEELAQTLMAHVKEGVPASDFLYREMESRGFDEAFLQLFESDNEELLISAVNLIGSNQKAFDCYFRLVTGDYGKETKDAAVEGLKGNADEAKEKAIAFYWQGTEKEYMLEVLSRCKTRDDRVFDILLNELRTSDEIPMRASYLASYGDDRALPVLLAIIDKDDINYLEFQELRYAIEALGGEYNKPRDFSNDPYFQEIASQSQVMPDFTQEKN